MDGITKLAPIVAFYAGKPEMLEKVEDAVRVTQNNDACVAETLAAARSVRLPSVRYSLSSLASTLLNYSPIFQVPGALHTERA